MRRIISPFIAALMVLSVFVVAVPPSAHAAAYSNLVYCSPSGVNQLMDLYMPSGNGPFPVVVEVHGGGWAGGSKSNKWALAEYPLLNALGIGLASVDYRLSTSGYTWPTPLQDVDCAIRFLRANAATYSVNSAKIGIFGESAGGQIGDMIAVTGGGVAHWGYGDDTFYQGYSSAVQAAAAWFPASNVTELSDYSTDGQAHITAEFGSTSAALEDGSVPNFVTSGAVPMTIYHGYNDTTINYVQSVELANTLSARGNSNYNLTLVNNAGHIWSHNSGWPAMTPTLQQIERDTANWFHAKLGGGKSGGGAPAAAPVDGSYAECQMSAASSCTATGFVTKYSPDIIIAECAVNTAGSGARHCSAPKDTASLAWKFRASEAGASRNVTEWYAITSSPLAADTLTCRQSGAGTGGCIFVAFLGINPTSPFDSASTPGRASGGPDTTPMVSSLSTSNPHDLWIGLVSEDGSLTQTPGSCGTAACTLIQSEATNPPSQSLEVGEITTSQSSASVSYGTASGPSRYWVMIADALRFSTKTIQKFYVSISDSSNTPTFSISGCGVSNSSITVDGHGKLYMGLTQSCSVTFTVPADGSGSRYRFPGGTTYDVTTCATWLCNPAKISASLQHYLTLDAGTGGSVAYGPAPSPPGDAGWYDNGTPVSFNATSSGGYVFSSWSCGGTGCYAGSSNPATVTLASAITETASFSAPAVTVSLVCKLLTGGTYETITFSGAASPSPTSGSCSASGSATSLSVSPSSALTVTVQTDAPTARYRGNSSWTGGTNYTLATPASGSETITIYNTYEVHLGLTGGTGGSVSPSSGWVDYGSSVKITATPSGGYAFVSWSCSGAGCYSGSSPSTQITANGGITETASFAAKSSPVTVSLECRLLTGGTTETISFSGAASPSTTTGSCTSAGSITSITADPARALTVTVQTDGTGSRYRGNSTWASQTSYTFTTVASGSESLTIYNIFEVYLNVTAGAGGTAAPASGWQSYGTLAPLQATPNSGYAFGSWSCTGTGCYAGVSASTTITMEAPITETASFSPGSGGGGGSGSVAGTATSTPTATTTNDPGTALATTSNATTASGPVAPLKSWNILYGALIVAGFSVIVVTRREDRA